MTESSAFQEFPKMLYRLCDGNAPVEALDVEGRKVEYRIVASAIEQRAAKGWSETPAQAVRKKRIRHWAQTVLKPWWEKWEWSLKLIAAVLVIVAAGAKIFEVLPLGPQQSPQPPALTAPSQTPRP
jgi:hypothetical protein